MGLRAGLWAGPPAQKAARTGPSQPPPGTLKKVSNGENKVKFGVPQKVPQGPSTKEQIGTFWPGPKVGLRRAQNGVKIGSKWHFHWPLIGKMTKIDFFNRKMTKIGQNWQFHGLKSRPGASKRPYLDRANRQVVRFKGQNGQNEAISRSRMEVQKWSKWPKFEVLAWVWEDLSRSSSPKAARAGLATQPPSGPSKGPKWSKLGSKFRVPQVPQGPSWTKGTNRHILARAKIWAQEELKIGQNRVKMAFSLTLIGKMTKIDFFSIGKVVKIAKIWGSRHGFVEAPNRSSIPKAARFGPSHSLLRTLKGGPQNGENWVKITGFWAGPERSLGLKADISWLLDRRLFEVLKRVQNVHFLLKWSKIIKITKFAKMCIKTEGINPRFP